jgi:lipid-A-disaccharide synthase
MGREVVKELIQNNLNTNQLKQEMDQCLHVDYSNNMLKDYKSLGEKLGEKNASKEAAAIVLSYIR